MTCIIAAKVEGGCLFAADSGAWETNQSVVMQSTTPKVAKCGPFVLAGAGYLCHVQQAMRIARQADSSASLEDLARLIYDAKFPADEGFRLLAYHCGVLAELDGSGCLNRPRGDWWCIGGAQSYVTGWLHGRMAERYLPTAGMLAEAVKSAFEWTGDAKPPVRLWFASNVAGSSLEELSPDPSWSEVLSDGRTS